MRRLPARFASIVLERFRQDKRASTAVEFGLICIPFIALIMAVIETALVLWSSQVLETAVANAGRRVFTGELAAQFAAANTPAAAQKSELQKQICASVPGLFDCANGLQIDVRTAKSFTNLPAFPPLIAGGEINSGQFVYQPSGSGDIVVIRAAFPYQLHMSFFASGFSNLSSQRRMVAAVAAFRNEPF